MSCQDLTDQEHQQIFSRIGKGSELAIDMAESILRLKDERDWLLDQLVHYMPYRRLYMESLNQSIAHSRGIIGDVLMAALDPDSVINEGMRAIEKKRSKDPA